MVPRGPGPGATTAVPACGSRARPAPHGSAPTDPYPIQTTARKVVWARDGPALPAGNAARLCALPQGAGRDRARAGSSSCTQHPQFPLEILTVRSHQFTESQEGRGWERPLQSIQSNPSRWVWDGSREGTPRPPWAAAQGSATSMGRSSPCAEVGLAVFICVQTLPRWVVTPQLCHPLCHCVGPVPSPAAVGQALPGQGVTEPPWPSRAVLKGSTAPFPSLIHRQFLGINTLIPPRSRGLP